jgi:hypothetical protein
MGAAARMLSTRRRTGSAKAKNPVASWAASTASRGAARTDEQHYSLSATTIARLRAAMLHGLLLTIVNVSTMINASTVVEYYWRLIVSRVQLALNMSDIEAAVDFYSKLFDTEPAKRRPGTTTSPSSSRPSSWS